MRTRPAGFADSIPYPIFLKSALLEVGGYDTQLHRNQDNDLCQKLRARGHKLYITDKTSCQYFVSPNLASLARYAFKTGWWNIISLKTNRFSMAMRHLVPGAFVAVALLSLLAFLISMDTTGYLRVWLRSPLFILSTIYVTPSIAAAFHVAVREKSVEALLMPIVFLVLHFSYGLGTLTAIVTNARPPSSELNEVREVAEPS
jgi:hypothetical protein